MKTDKNNKLELKALTHIENIFGTSFASPVATAKSLKDPKYFSQELAVVEKQDKKIFARPVPVTV